MQNCFKLTSENWLDFKLSVPSQQMLTTVTALYCSNTPSWDNTSASLEIWNISRRVDTSCKTALMAAISAKSTVSFMSLASLLGKWGAFRKG